LADGWGALPRLTLAAYRTAATVPDQRVFRFSNAISQPMSVIEGSGPGARSVVDTLYLNQAATYDPDQTTRPDTDARPNAIDCHASGQGEVVWFGFPLYVFERDQARQVAYTVLTHLGVEPATGGDRGASPFVPTVPPGPANGRVAARASH